MKNKKTKKIINFSWLEIVLLITTFLIYYIFLFLKTQFSNLKLDEIIFHLKVPLENASNNYFDMGVEYCLSKVIFIAILLLLINYLINKITIEIDIKKINFKLNVSKIYLKSLKYILLVFIIFTFININKHFYVTTYIQNTLKNGKIYEEYYIKPSSVDITFPDKKKNLIYIYVESLETTDLSKKSGGARENSLLPNLENLLLKKNNINFSHSKNIGGFQTSHNTTWTLAAMVAQTAGIPVKVYGGVDFNTFENYEYFLKGTYTIGDVLEKNGYKNYFLMGSNKDFANRGIYLESHGNYKVYDFFSAVNDKKIPRDYDIEWWGFEDKKLYEYAKEQLLEISKNKEPFNYNILTVDTHPYGGYLDESCEIDETLEKYHNVFKCADSMLGDFVSWLEKQDFYKDTTIVIVGDHLNQTTKFIYEYIDENYSRTSFNLFINANNETACNKNRIFTSMDLFPTTLAALGANIQGNRLALGTNLFSCEETLAEIKGLDNLNNELSLGSQFYDKCLFHGECK